MGKDNFNGECLRRARIEKGYTLDDLQQLTKIQKRYLIAIEENNLEELPGDFFVRAFIRQYAEVVGISLDDHESLLTETRLSETNAPSKQIPSRMDLRRSSNETKFNSSNSSQNGVPTFLVVLFFIFILGIIWFYFNFIRDNSTALNLFDLPTTLTVAVDHTGRSGLLV